jgi:hypothetical protein
MAWGLNSLDCEDSPLAVKDFSVRLGQAEIGRILNLKENLDLKELLVTYAPHYQKLGWVLVGLNPSDGTHLEIDLGQPPAQWSRQFSDLGVDDLQINLGVRTGKASNLLVLEVNHGEGALALDQRGAWRADCVAAMGDCREQHYYALPVGSPSPPSFFLAPQVLIYGEGGLVPAPPSLEPQAREPWRWLRPPWEAPLQPPPPAVWQFLQEQVPAALQPELPDWSELYRMIAPHGPLLQALLGVAASQEEYYQKILQTALGLGLNAPTVLVGLLWHAPHGEARYNPDKLAYFQELVARARDRQPGAYPVPGSQPLVEGRAPETALSGLPLNLDLLETYGDPGPANPGMLNQEASSACRFDQSVSGQFFQLLAGLGEKVIMETCRYEAVAAGFKNQAGDPGNLISPWEHQVRYSSPTQPESEQKPTAPGEMGFDALVNRSAHRRRRLQEIQTAAGDFLNQNPDLAKDQEKVQMVIFCLKNYISLNPDYAGLPFREKLDRAGVLARGFLAGREDS